jgi:hypothetical protein
MHKFLGCFGVKTSPMKPSTTMQNVDEIGMETHEEQTATQTESSLQSELVRFPHFPVGYVQSEFPIVFRLLKMIFIFAF